MADARHLPVVPAVRDRPGGLLRADHRQGRARAGAPAGRRRERARQRALPLRPPRDGHARSPLDWEPDGPIWKFLTGWPNTRSDDPDEMVLRIHSWLVGLGGSHHRLRGRAAAPPDLHRHPGRARRVRPLLHGVVAPAPRRRLADCRRRTCRSGSTRSSSPPWRTTSRSGATSSYIENPALAKQDAKPYKALRTWAMQFYDVPADA